MKIFIVSLGIGAALSAAFLYFRREFKRDERIAQRARELGIGEEEEQQYI